MRQRIFRILWRTFQAFLVLFVLAGIGLYLGRDELLRKAATELESLGLPPIELEISEISFDRIGFSGVSIGDTVKVRDLKAGFAWREVLTGKFDRITIENPEMTVRQIDDRLDFGDLNPLIFAEDTSTDDSEFDIVALQEALPFRHLILRNATIFVLSDQGTTELHFDADISSVGADIKIENARLTADHGDVASFTAEAFGTLSDDGSLSANLNNLFGAFDLGFASGEAIGGKGYINGNLLALDTLSSSFRLRLESVAAPFGLTGNAELEAETTGTSGDFVIRAFEESTGAASRLSISAQNEDDDHTIKVALQFSAPDLTAASAPFLPDLPLTGQLDLSIDTATKLSRIVAAGQLPTPWEQALATAPIDLRIRGSGLGLEIFPLALDTTLALRLETDENRKAVRFLEPLTVMAEAGHTEGRVYQTVLPYLDTRYDGPLQVEFGKAGDIGIWFVADQNELITAQTDLATSFSGGGIAPTRIALKGSGTSSQQSFDTARFDLTEFRMIVDDWQSSQARISGVDVSVAAKGSADLFDGSAKMSARVAVDDRSSSISFDIGTDSDLRFHRDRDRLDIGVIDCGAITIQSLTVSITQLLSKNNRFCLRTPNSVTLKMKDDLSVSGNARLTFPKNLLRVRLPNGQRIAVGGSKSALELSLSPLAQDHPTQNVSGVLNLSNLYTTDPKFAAGNISIAYDGDLMAETATMSVKIDRLESLESPALFTPAVVENDTKITGNDITHSGSIRLVSGDARVEFDVSHDRDAASGTGVIRPIPLQFGPDDVSIEDVSPAAGAFFRLFTATLLGAASIDWDEKRFCIEGDTILQRFSLSPQLAIDGETINSDGGQLAGRALVCQNADGTQTSTGELLIENLNVRFGALELLRMNTVLDLPEIIPTLQTAPEQPFSIAVANLGVPLTAGSGNLTIAAPDSLDIDDFGFEWAGGKVTSGPVRVRDGTIADGLKLNLSDIDLTKLVGLLQLGDQLEAEGVIGGSMTVTFEDGQPKAIDGALSSKGKGTLRYLGGDLGTDVASSLLAQAVSNFQYDKIEVKISGKVTEEAKITLHLVGKNPDLHDGHPLDLEVSVNGRLAALFKESLGAYQVPTQIKERMLGYGQ